MTKRKGSVVVEKVKSVSLDQLQTVIEFLGHTCPADLHEMGFHETSVMDIVSFFYDNQEVLDGVNTENMYR